MTTKQGRYTATYAHKDIAFEFTSWISPEFKLYIIKDYQRLKADENGRLSLNWNMNREISKINYRIHADAIKEYLVVPELPKQYQRLQFKRIMRKILDYGMIIVPQSKIFRRAILWLGIVEKILLSRLI